MLTIWGRSTSINVQKVLWACVELSLPFTRHDIGGTFGGTDTDRYRLLNPNGLVPTIEDNGLVLWESNVIVRYLATKQGAAIFPQDLLKRFDIERWMEWQTTTLWPALRPAFIALIRTSKEKRDETSIARAEDDTRRLFTILDQQLQSRSYIAGDSFTIADIACGVTARRWYELDIARPNLPSVRRWYDELSQRPGFRQHIAIPLS
ncbi:MAG TPA: glutathione S-transferase [Microvirga sp.]|jgi:glutathione S-transferase|nr:glutathione S-transferase [Microvirga sp.]